MSQKLNKKVTCSSSASRYHSVSAKAPLLSLKDQSQQSVFYHQNSMRTEAFSKLIQKEFIGLIKKIYTSEGVGTKSDKTRAGAWRGSSAVVSP